MGARMEDLGGFTVHWWDIAGLVLWFVIITLAVMDSLDGRLGVDGMWAMIMAPMATGFSLVTLRRRETRTTYERGVANGLEAAGIVHLVEHR